MLELSFFASDHDQMQEKCCGSGSQITFREPQRFSAMDLSYYILTAAGQRKVL